MPTINLTVKYDTYDNWRTNNPVLGSGEASVDTTNNNKVKLGDGTTKWNDLPYITNSITDAIIKNTKGVILSSGQSLVTSKLYYNPATNLLTVGNDGNGTISASKLLGTANESLYTSGVKQLSSSQVGTRLGEMYYDTHDNCLCICTDAVNNKWAKLYDNESIESTYLLRKYTLDLSYLDPYTFYPVLFDETYQSIEAEIYSRMHTSHTINNELSFKLFANVEDSIAVPPLIIKDCYLTTQSEITIGCLASGDSGACVWLKGGQEFPYTIISTTKPQLYENGRTDEDTGQVAAKGPAYYGSDETLENGLWTIRVSPLDLPNHTVKNYGFETIGLFDQASRDSDGKVIKDTYATKADTYTKTESDDKYALKSATYNKTAIDEKLSSISDGVVVPTGTMIFFCGTLDQIPKGYLNCDGSEVSRSTYANLFNVIGINYGTGDGSTTFNLPNLSGQFGQIGPIIKT